MISFFFFSKLFSTLQRHYVVNKSRRDLCGVLLGCRQDHVCAPARSLVGRGVSGHNRGKLHAAHPPPDLEKMTIRSHSPPFLIPGLM